MKIRKVLKIGVPIMLVFAAAVLLIFTFAVPIIKISEPQFSVSPELIEILAENKAEKQIYDELKNLKETNSIIILTYDETFSKCGETVIPFELINLQNLDPVSISLELISDEILNANISIRQTKLWDAKVTIDIKLTIFSNEEIQSVQRVIYTNNIPVLYLFLPQGINNVFDNQTWGETDIVKAILSNGNDNFYNVNSSQCIVLAKGGNDTIKKAGRAGTCQSKDLLFGGKGNDYIESFYVNTMDELYGGSGNDILKGGLNKNVFYSSSAKDVSIGYANDVFKGPGKKVIIE